MVDDVPANKQDKMQRLTHRIISSIYVHAFLELIAETLAKISLAHFGTEQGMKLENGRSVRCTLTGYRFLIGAGHPEDSEGHKISSIHLDRPRVHEATLFYHPLVHEGAQITQGRKYVMRTDLMFPA